MPNEDDVVAPLQAPSVRSDGDFHWGPDPGHGGLTKHEGSRKKCNGPDCHEDSPVHPINELVDLLAEAVNLPSVRDVALLVDVVQRRFWSSTWAVQGHVFLNGTQYCECGKHIGSMKGWVEHTAELRAQGLPTALPEVDETKRDLIEDRLGMPVRRCADCQHVASMHFGNGCMVVTKDEEDEDSYCLCDSQDFKVSTAPIAASRGE